MKHALMVSGLLMLAMGATTAAADDPSQTNTIAVPASAPPSPTQFEDPDTYADDICWVAAEWRDD